jgi:uncharacterized SAM-binding protein YcdF (DUF218 family)
MRRWAGLAIAGAAILAWGEWLNGRWSRTLVGNSDGATEAVVVLGYRNPQPTANFINRWRVRAGMRSIAAGRRDARMIFSGGTTTRGVSEAEVMADYARSVAEFDGAVLLEDKSATTWENVTNVVAKPLLALCGLWTLRNLRADERKP